MVWIPGGDFTMGSTEENPATSALPIRKVKVDGFWMDETEPYLFRKLSQIKPRLFPAYNYYLYLHENKKPDCGH